MDQKFHYPTGLWRGGGGPDPFIVKDYENGPFFFAAFPYHDYAEFEDHNVYNMMVKL